MIQVALLTAVAIAGASYWRFYIDNRALFGRPGPDPTDSLTWWLRPDPFRADGAIRDAKAAQATH